MPEQNTIKKAYICRAKGKVSQGDVLLFYRSDDIRAVTSIGIVESAYYGITDADQVQRLVSKRTVYSKREIEEHTQPGATVILFRHCFDLRKKVTARELKTFSLSVPQSITFIDDQQYYEIIKRGDLDGRFTIH